MDITISLDDMIDTAEREVLKRLLACNTDEELQLAMTSIGVAAMNEYLEMLLGKQVPTKANEVQERRLLHLMKHYFRDRFPSESEIASMFQLTESGSATLLRHTRTKYRFELEAEMVNTIKTTLLSTRSRGDTYRVVITSENVLEELKKTVSIDAPQLDQISKVKNSAGVYNIPPDTFEVLCNHYGVPMDQIEAAAAREE